MINDDIKDILRICTNVLALRICPMNKSANDKPKVGIQLCPFRVWWCLAPFVGYFVWPAPWCRLKLIVIMTQMEQRSGEPAHFFWSSKWYILLIYEIHGILGTMSKTSPFWSGRIVIICAAAQEPNVVSAFFKQILIQKNQPTNFNQQTISLTACPRAWSAQWCPRCQWALFCIV